MPKVTQLIRDRAGIPTQKISALKYSELLLSLPWCVLVRFLISLPYTSPPYYPVGHLKPRFTMAAFLWLACPLLVKELDCRDVDFWEAPAFQKEGLFDQ